MITCGDLIDYLQQFDPATPVALTAEVNPEAVALDTALTVFEEVEA